jgi:hypothetical protein
MPDYTEIENLFNINKPCNPEGKARTELLDVSFRLSLTDIADSADPHVVVTLAVAVDVATPAGPDKDAALRRLRLAAFLLQRRPPQYRQVAMMHITESWFLASSAISQYYSTPGGPGYTPEEQLDMFDVDAVKARLASSLVPAADEGVA